MAHNLTPTFVSGFSSTSLFFGHCLCSEIAKAIEGRVSKWCWCNWISVDYIMNLDLSLTPCTKLAQKWITVLNVNNKTIKLVGDNTGENLKDLGHGEEFLDMTQKTHHKRKDR